MSEHVPESEEVLRAALHDRSLAEQGFGWSEEQVEGLTVWSARVPGILLVVLPENGRFTWFVGRDEDTDQVFARGEADTDTLAREEATMWYNRNRHDLY